MAGPLAGMRVIDMTTVVLGPYATQILGDLGAEVIKIESPEGDVVRHLTPGRSPGMSGITLNVHRNKRSLVLDLKQEAGRDALLRLVESADLLVHNMRPKAMARLGLSYEDLKAVNDKIVYCAAFGFGQEGPYADYAAYDDIIQASSGVADLMARSTGAPAYFPGVMADKVTGLTVVYAAIAALLHRERTGEGQLVEVPMLETMVSFNLVEHFADATFEPPLAKFGYARVLAEHRRPYKTADGHVCLLAYSDKQWRDFFKIAGSPELADDPRFADIGSRTRNIEALYAEVSAAALKMTTSEWIDACRAHHIPCMTMLELDALEEDPHLRATGFFTEDEHPSEGRYKRTAVPTQFSASPTEHGRHAPRLGENSLEVLKELGLSDEEVLRMVESGATVDGRGD